MLFGHWEEGRRILQVKESETLLQSRMQQRMFLSGSHLAVNYVTLPNSNIVSCQKTAAPCISCHVQRALPDDVESLDKWAAFPQGFPQVVMKVGQGIEVGPTSPSFSPSSWEAS